MSDPSSELFYALQQSLSSDLNERKAGEARLTTWETEKNFFVALLQVYLNTSLQQRVRSLSIILLKNGIDKYWRKTAKNR